MEQEILISVENYIYDYYKNNSPTTNVYHNLSHIKYVVKLVNEFGTNSGLSEDDLEVLKIAAWFHDIGHIETWEGHEKIGVEHAKKFLSEQRYDNTKIEKVCNCILSTRLPHKPNNLLEEIICDADIAHIGSKEFLDLSDLLRIEIENRKGKKISDSEWLKKNIDFITKNDFFSKYAKFKLEKKRNANLLKLQKSYKKKLEKKKEIKTKNEKLAVEKEKLKKKNIESKKSDRGIETMFRNVMRTHVSFSAMADNKANIMISVNTLLLGAIFTILARKLDTNPHLILPTVVLTLVSLVTLILAVRVTRPTISSGTFTKKDIENKNTNLLFFGNFYKMNLKDFSWGMQQMMEDKNFLYGSMIKDFYYLGQVLGTKYRLLRLCYTIFMYGIVVASILFGIYVWLNPAESNLNTLID